MKKELFIDSDIILDILLERKDFYDSAAEIFDLAYEGEIKLYTTAVVMANIFYILRKKIGIERSKEQLKKLRTIITILPIENKIIDNSLDSKFGDFEDGLQYFTAKENNIQNLITRNIKHYKENDVVVFTAEEYLQIVKKEKES